MSKLTTFKLLFYPLEILLFLFIILSLFYFRPIIFHQNVTEPVDFVFSIIEDKFDIVIPVYKTFNNNRDTDMMIDRSYEIVSNKEQIDVRSDEGDESDLVASSELVDSVVSVEVNSDEKPIELDALVSEDAEELVSLVSEGSELVVEDNVVAAASSFEINKINNALDEIVNRMNALTKDGDEYNKLSQKLDQLSSEMESLKKDAEVKVNTTDDVVNVALTDKLNVHELRNLARSSYWKGEVDQSETYYLDLLENGQSDPDVFGELGNVYYAQGKWKLAGQAYYEAALRLHELKQIHQVNYLLRIIQGLDKESADKLRQKMSG